MIFKPATRPLVLAAILALGIDWLLAGTQASGENVLPERTRITLRLNDYLSTKLNSEGDPFTAEVSVPVYQGDRVVIPKGAIVTGSVSRVLRPGRFKGKAVMNLVFQSIRIPGHGEVPLVASLARVDVDGNAGVRAEGTVQGEGSLGADAGRVAKPGLSGAGIGALAGGRKGAAVGAGVGAVVGLATVFATRGKDLEVRRGATMDIELDRPLTIPPENEAPTPRNR